MKNIHFTIALAIASSAANAGVLDMQFTGKGAGSKIQIQIGEDNAFNVFAGQLEHSITNATGVDAYLNGSHSTFCADISEHVTRSGAQYHTADLESIPLNADNDAPMTSIQADAIRSLYNQTSNNLLEGGVSNAFATAMQLTIWEIVNDFDGTADSINLNSGSVRFAGKNGTAMNLDVINIIDSLKIQLISGINRDPSQIDQVIGLANDGAQDQLITVPAPGAISLLAAGTLMVTRRRRS